MPYKDPERKKANDAAYRAANRRVLADKQRERERRKFEEDPEAFREKRRESVRRQKERDPEGFRQKQREAARRQYRKKSKDPEFRSKNVQRVAKWVDKNRGRANAKWREIRQRRMREDVKYRLSVALRRRLYMAVKGRHRSGTAIDELGCSIEELKQHLEAQFKEGMSWENWGRYGWHIDHIMPLSSFNLTDPAQVKAACHYTNLQPLWAEENLRKHG